MAENKLLKAWHASPYDFEQFGPMRDVSGKGQGAAAYGRGAAYVAENPKVSGPGESEYMKEFQYHPNIVPESLGGATLNQYVAGDDFAGELLRGLKLEGRHLPALHDSIKDYLAAGGRQGSGKDLLRFIADRGHPGLAAKLVKYYQPGNGTEQRAGPFSYEVEVHLQPETTLDWDEPISKNHPSVYEKVGKMAEEGSGLIHGENDNATGAEMYRILSNIHGSDFDASEALFEAGIHGIRYKDAGSRKSHVLMIDGHEVGRGWSHPEFPGAVSNAIRFTAEENDGVKDRQSLLDALHSRASRLEAATGQYPDDYEAAIRWLSSDKHKVEAVPVKPTYNYVIFHPDFVRAVAQYDIKGQKVKDLGPGVHLKAVDHDPFEGEK